MNVQANAAVPLDPLAVPLWGSRLIEASAGTGKTWTIAALYLRLVLGDGAGAADVDADDDTRFARPLVPGEILVMTFTIAATRELRERIRTRLVDAAACFRGEAAPASSDGFLRALLERHAATRAIAARRLAAAAEAMDDAAVLTIDAWCQRMLREHAFDSGSAFDETVQPDHRPLLRIAAQDYWRRQVYPLREAALERVLAVWPTVDALYDDLEKLLGYDDVDDGDERSVGDLLAAYDAVVGARLVDLKAGWVERARAMRAWLEPHLGRTLNRNKMKPETVVGWLDTLDRWAASPSTIALELDRGLVRLTTAGLADAFNKGATPDIPPVFDAFGPLVDALAALPGHEAGLRRHAMSHVMRRIAAMRERMHAYGFTEMLQRLERALLGPGGPALRARIVAQFPVALIDEFQDTSPLQYRIFDRLYDVAANDRHTALFLIGDPKQSIYGFRGADLRSYLRAARSAGTRRYPLVTNHRATAACVAVVNRLFEGAEARPGEGAFRFRDADVDGDGDRLPFVPARAHGRADRLVERDGPVPALTLVHDPRQQAKAVAHDVVAGHCAERIVALLDDVAAGFAGPDDDVPRRRLRAGDIAVLVRNRHEAATIRSALQARGVPSVYLSDSESIFRTDEASDLVHWLRAVHAPDDARLVRTALATHLAGFTWSMLATLNADDVAFEDEQSRMRELGDLWRRQGVLPMLRATLHRHGLPSRWLAEADGERRLTNVLQLAELLQAASAGLEGEQALVRWLAARIAAKEVPDDAQVVRLESDADLVQVMTVHVAKGLEFPFVCIPFGSGHRPADKRSFHVVDDGGRRLVRFFDGAGGDDAQARFAHEVQQEELRLFYVAVTRAQYALWIGVPSLGSGKRCDFDRSALGWLLAGREVAADGIAPLLHATFDDLSQVRIEVVDDVAPVTRLASRDARPALGPAATYDASFERDWSIGSFSAFVRDLERVVPSAEGPVSTSVATAVAPALIDPATEEELRTGPVEDDAGVASLERAAARHRFPRGAFVGHFLHGQLEWLAARRFALKDPTIAAALVERVTRQGWGRRAHDVATWLGEVVSTPLPPVGVALDALPRVLPEMEFWFPSETVDAAALDRWCRDALLPGRDRPALPGRTLHGMLMGFADLTFEHDGRYWVLDYKSNALGTRDADYTADALADAMASHRYDVQGAIYLLALHRLLRARLGERYDPRRQLGGAVCLFMRGIAGPAAGCCVLAPDAQALDALDRLVGRTDAVTP